MTREKYEKIFRNKDKLQEMLFLQSQGWSYLKLAKRFNCDHTSILYQVKKHGSNEQTIFTKIIRRIYRKSKSFEKKKFCSVCGIRLTSEYAGKAVGDKCEECNKKY